MACKTLVLYILVILANSLSESKAYWSIFALDTFLDERLVRDPSIPKNNAQHLKGDSGTYRQHLWNFRDNFKAPQKAEPTALITTNHNAKNKGFAKDATAPELPADLCQRLYLDCLTCRPMKTEFISLTDEVSTIRRHCQTVWGNKAWSNYFGHICDTFYNHCKVMIKDMNQKFEDERRQKAKKPQIQKLRTPDWYKYWFG